MLMVRVRNERKGSVCGGGDVESRKEWLNGREFIGTNGGGGRGWMRRMNCVDVFTVCLFTSYMFVYFFVFIVGCYRCQVLSFVPLLFFYCFVLIYFSFSFSVS